MSSRGNLQRKCVKAHPKAAGKCSSRCIRWYPRLELPRGPDGARRFEALGGYPTRAHAKAALADALARRSHGFVLDPAKLTVNQYLDRWLDHIRTTRCPRTVARYTALPRPRPTPHRRPPAQAAHPAGDPGHLRPPRRRRPPGRQAGRAGPQHILAVHRCLHRALTQALTWRLLAHNPATHATPPPLPRPEAVALAPEQVAVAPTTPPARGLAPGRRWPRRPGPATASCVAWNGPTWTWTPAPSGSARPSPSSTPPSSQRTPMATVAGVGGGRRELAVGPLKSAASSAILTLPPFAVQALRQHRRQQHRLRLALGQAPTLCLRWVEPGQAPRPGQVGSGLPHRAGHASQSQPRQPRLRPPGRQRGAGRPPAPAPPCLGVGDGGHQLPQTAPRLAGVIEGVFGSAARHGRAVSAGRRAEGKWRETRPSSPT
jgi:hypothetical protein